MTPFSFIDGFPISRGCKMKEKISVKTRDCEHKIVGGFFERRCFCRRMLCNLGYDDRYKLFNRYTRLVFYMPIYLHTTTLCRQDIMRGEIRGKVLPYRSLGSKVDFCFFMFLIVVYFTLSQWMGEWRHSITKKIENTWSPSPPRNGCNIA